MIFHRLYRSSIEYCYRLFKVRPSGDKNVEIFKTNRIGWNVYTPCSDKKAINNQGQIKDLAYLSEAQSYFAHYLPAKAIDDYHTYLEAFISKCSIANDVTCARSLITSDRIEAMIIDIPPKNLKKQLHLLNKIFYNTQYIELIESIIQSNA